MRLRRLAGRGLALACLLAAAADASAQSAAPSAPAARLSLGGSAPRVRTEAELRAFLDELEAQELMVSEALNLEAYFQWKGETRHYAAPFGRFMADLTSRRDYAAIIDRWRGRVSDSTLARRLFLHQRDFLTARVAPALPLALVDLQAAIQDTVGQFRYSIGGKPFTRTDLAGLRDTSQDRALRKAAFLAGIQVSSRTRTPILQALALNGRIARQQGFADAAAGGLNNASLEPAQVIRDLDAFERATRPAFDTMLEHARRDLGVERVEAWDLDYWLHRQELAAGTDAWPKDQGMRRLRELMLGLGFAFDSLPIDVRVWDVPTGGITFPVRPGLEARLLTNPFNGSNFYETLFHEYGHALNAVLMRKDLSPVFMRGDETPLGEGVAEALGHFAYDRHWLRAAAGVSAADAEVLEGVGKMQLLLWLRRSIALNAYFEISQYLRPLADKDSLYAAAYHRFAGAELPSGDWFATRDMFATGPLYLQSYLYANMIAAQLREAMGAEFGVEDLTREPRVAEWLTRHFFADGAAVPWQEKVRRATGRPLSTEALARYLAGARPVPAR